jgi:hypothetical protein
MVALAFSPGDDDIITYTDADEIPRPTVYDSFSKRGWDVAVLDMMFLMYYMNYRVPIRWRYPKVCTGAFWKQVTPFVLRFSVMRSKWEDWGIYGNMIGWGGWHFSWLGDRQKRRLKALSTSHCNDKECAGFLRKLEVSDTPGIEDRGRFVAIDKRWPEQVRNNIGHYKEIGFIK